ncbi:MAG: hypothetical protein ACJA2W_003514 [Planctomycetota bacterium]|jgi:hypothetical protein
MGADVRDVEMDGWRVFRLWWPLAASWILMAMEPTLVIATVSRLDDPKVHLAAWNSVVFPISLACEGPIIMMLAAAARLSSSWERYRKVMKYGHIMGLVLTCVHAAIAFTPLYDIVAVDVLGSDPSVIEPARLGLMIMLPWTYAIGYRRAQQGALIRFERSGVVGQGTLLRLAVTGGILLGLMHWTELGGATVAACGVSAGVTAEAIFAGWRVREIYPNLKREQEGEEILPGNFARFYGPLALTPLITLLIQPLGSAAMNRMPNSLDAVAAWGPVHALVFTMRSVGMAFNEVVVTLVALQGGRRALIRFGAGLAVVTSSIILLVWATPLAGFWFGTVQNIPSELIPVARIGVGICILMPAYQVAQSWFQGLLVHRKETRGITEAVLLYFVVSFTLLRLGVEYADDVGVNGLSWTLMSFVTAGILQTLYLWWRSGHSATSEETLI